MARGVTRFLPQRRPNNDVPLAKPAESMSGIGNRSDGWSIYIHPLMQGQLDRLSESVARAQRSNPEGWRHHPDARLLAMITELMFERIPRDPLAPNFRQGNTLGPERRHWFRAKFGGSRFRLFYRCDSAAKVIVYAWVNDRNTLRKQGAGSDPYAVFNAMLSRGNPPDDLAGLLAASSPAG